MGGKMKKKFFVAMVTWKICLFLIKPDSYTGRKIIKTRHSSKLKIGKININRWNYAINQKKFEKIFSIQNGRH